MKGYIHIYTGNGKGKTTAAFGLALRACGAGLNVFIGQFIKGKKYHEFIPVKKYMNNITIRQYGLECFIVNTPSEDDISAAKEGLKEMARIIQSSNYDLVIMDEVFIALYYKLFNLKELITAIHNKQENIELILTGRYAPQELIDIADLVTEMKEVKHYYAKGVMARKGIEY